MTDKCAHVLGLLHGKDITEIDCQAVRSFVEDVREFNTSRKALSHPGWFNLAVHCHKCGAKLDKELNNDELNKIANELGGWGQ
ncbi:hypothetical protein [Vibrio parahaemolyticus]|uniref:hypothetical protein n=1 Tax=Vibrio parahaemolyticus TaxID=670 RepID=UPI0023ED7FF5|nr:hypothetical protein [Vibrio parahaemolyticus]